MAMEHPLDLLRDYVAIGTGAQRRRRRSHKRFTTLLDVAQARGARVVDGMVAAAEFERVGVTMVVGCHTCGATATADVAYPTTSGHIECGECIGRSEDGFVSVVDANRST